MGAERGAEAGCERFWGKGRRVFLGFFGDWMRGAMLERKFWNVSLEERPKVWVIKLQGVLDGNAYGQFLLGVFY